MISCRRARSLLVEHVRGAAGEAALFQLDQHLVACAKCRRERARWETAGALRDWRPPALGDAARARIAKNLLAARPAAAGRRRAAARPLLLAGALAAVAVAPLAWRAMRSKPPVVASAPEGARRFDSAGTLGFLDAQLGYRAGTQVELQAKTRTVALAAGELDVNAPANAAPVRVTTPGFVVTVRHARAVFAASSVRVVDGQVDVYTPDGRWLTAVAAGRAWSPDSAPNAPTSAPKETSPASAPTKTPPASAPTETAPASAPTETAPASAPTETARVVAAAAHAPAHDRSSVAAALDRARSALADGDAPRARHWLDEALAAHPPQRDRAEAELFWAESYLVEQDPERALAAFRRVADSYPRLAEGESAAFAAAQVLFERGRHADAAAALRAYLERYPQGRFAREARDRIAELPTAP